MNPFSSPFRKQPDTRNDADLLAEAPVPQLSSCHRIKAIDALRGLAALAVVMSHYFGYYDSEFGHQSELFHDFYWGRRGVALFFIISGFVILMSLDRVKSVSEFAVRRFARLYPVYWMSILITVALMFMGGLPGQVFWLKGTVINMTMFQRYLGVAHINSVYWTLQREFFFYVLLALLYAIGMRKALIPILSTIVTFDCLLRVIDPTDQLAVNRHYLLAPLNIPYMHMFLIGICFYEWRVKQVRWASFGIIYCLLAAIYAQGLGYGGVIAMLIVMFGFALTGFGQLLENKILLFFGKISYSLYLVHWVVGQGLIHWSYQAGFHAYVGISIAIVVSIALAWLICVTVELPANRLLIRWYASENKWKWLKKTPKPIPMPAIPAVDQ